ncbi:Na+/H+ antiporter NhaC family protein, partial [Bacillus sp. D-CC]
AKINDTKLNHINGTYENVATPKIMEDSYDKLKIDRRVLARNSEVGGTLTSGMVPWSDNGIFMAGILGVATFSYVPFMWLSFVSLILAVILAIII